MKFTRIFLVYSHIRKKHITSEHVQNETVQLTDNCNVSESSGIFFTDKMVKSVFHSKPKVGKNRYKDIINKMRR
jgi:hypothetical protein